MSRDPSVSICTPYLLTPDPAQVTNPGHTHTCAVVGLHKPPKTEYTAVPNLPVDEARNLCVEASKHDYVFFMDCDQTFHPNTLKRLMSRDKDIITGVYFARGGYPIPHIYKWYRQRDGDEATLYKPFADIMSEHLVANHAEVYGKPPAWVLEEAKDEHVIEIDGCGLGCILIKREVFEKIPKPWFERTTDRGGEDFDFCRKVQEAGFKIYADLSVMCGHWAWEERGWRHFLSYSIPEPYPWVSRTQHEHDIADMLLGEGLIGDMADYLKMTPAELIQLLEGEPQKDVAYEWTTLHNPKTQQDRDLFYSTCKTYLLDLTMWNVSPTYRQIIDMLPQVEDKTVLDFGAGLGSSSLWLAAMKAKRVDYYDLSGVLQDFAKWRIEKLDQNTFINFLPSLNGASDKYDLVVAIDVFEHIPKDTLDGILGQLWQSLKDKGQLFCHVEFDKHDGVYPQHFEYGDEFQDMMRTIGFKQLQMAGSIQLWQKEAW